MGTVVPYAQGLLIMIYIQNVVNLIASLIQQHTLLSLYAIFFVQCQNDKLSGAVFLESVLWKEKKSSSHMQKI
jgi:hypothetical protein